MFSVPMLIPITYGLLSLCFALQFPWVLLSQFDVLVRLGISSVFVLLTIAFVLPFLVQQFPPSWKLASFQRPDWKALPGVLLQSWPYQITVISAQYFTPSGFPISNGIGNLFLEVGLSIIVFDFGLWAAHRLVHSRSLWHHHRFHHEWVSVNSWAYVDTTMMDFLLEASPGFLTIFFCSSWASLRLGGFLSSLVNILAHSGIHGIFFSEHHAAHHLLPGANYGIWGIADWVLGTSRSYQETVRLKKATGGLARDHTEPEEKGRILG